jgi:SAM-dependent methyltransferase
MSAPLWMVYDEMAAHYERQVAEHPYNAQYDRPAVLEMIGEVDGKRVLDAGCGPGLYADELLSRGAEVVAFDASRPMVELARARLGARATVHHAVLGNRLPFPDASFDAVVCALTIHYVDDRVAALRELDRVLRPDGRIVLSTHHPTREWLNSDRSYFDVYLHDDHWQRDDTTYVLRYWRFPLSLLCDEIFAAGLIVDRLVETRPDLSMKATAPETWTKLNREPGFLAFRLRRRPHWD